MTNTIPHFRVVVAFCIAAIAGYTLFSFWVVFTSGDVGLRADVIGTWKSFAVAAFAFWMGSSSGGKAKPADATGKPDDPVNVTSAPEKP